MAKAKTGAKKAPSKKTLKDEPQVVLSTPTTLFLQEFGAKVRTERRAIEMTLEKLAEITGVSSVTITNLEKQRLENASLELLFKIAEGLGMKIELSIS